MNEELDLLNINDNAIRIITERYLKRNENGEIIETPLQLFQRVAENIAIAELAYGGKVQEIAKEFLNLMISLDFLPNTPTLVNAGTPFGQLAACFVLPIDDSVDSIFKVVREAAIVQESGGGVGFSFSKIRPRGDISSSGKGLASGPIPYLQVFDATTQCIKQSGLQRGANMGVLNIDHPDIEEFIRIKKENPSILTNFNLSVCVPDNFMEALSYGHDFSLVNPRTKEVEKSISAKELFDQIVEMTWSTGDPGMIFRDRINRDNPTPQLGSIEGTNPCGETPLLPYECCVLGSINLSHMIVEGRVDWEKLAKTVQLGVRFLDNIIDVNQYPLPDIKNLTFANRKIGLGVMGWADALIKLQLSYDSEQGVIAAEEVMEFINYHAKLSSINLARERGRFPEFDGSAYIQNPMFLVHEEIRSVNILPNRPQLDWKNLYKELIKYGLRNATVTTIAPTGSISFISDTSGGIEPIYSLAYTRLILGQKVQMTNNLLLNAAKHYGFDNPVIIRDIYERGSLKGMSSIPETVRRLFVTAHDIAPQWHIEMQAAFQKYVDNAVSKTVNLPSNATREDIADIFVHAHTSGCKGVTIYRDGSKKEQILTGQIQEGVQSTPKLRPVPDGQLIAKSYSVNTPSGKMTIFIREVEEKPFDVFVVLGRSGADITAYTEAIGRLLSIALRSNIPVDILAENLIGLGGRTSIGYGVKRILSVPDAIGGILQKEYLKTPELKNRRELCPECKNESLEYTEGCLKCPICGFAEC